MFWKPSWKCILGEDKSNVRVLLLQRKRKLLFPLISAPRRSATEFPKETNPSLLFHMRKKKTKNTKTFSSKQTHWHELLYILSTLPSYPVPSRASTLPIL